MKALFSLQHGLELMLAMITVGLGVDVLYQFVIGQHYIIPTALLVPTIILGNLVVFGLRGALWAQTIVFWIGFLATANLFFGIFFAKTPPELLGAAFLPTWIALTAGMGFLTYSYARRNGIFGRAADGR